MRFGWEGQRRDNSYGWRRGDPEQQSPQILVVAVVAAVWASVSAVGSAATEINKRRDLVITGSLEDEPLALAHREIIMWFDWLPMILATLAACVAFAIGILYFAKTIPHNGFRPAFYGCALIPALATVGLALTTICELRYMESVLAKAQAAPPRQRIPLEQSLASMPNSLASQGVSEPDDLDFATDLFGIGDGALA